MTTTKRSRKAFGVALLFLLGAAAAAPLCAQTPAPSIKDDVPTLAPLVKQVTPGVVNISTSGKVRIEDSPLFSDPNFRRFLEDPRFRRFFSLPDPQAERETHSIGSGVIVDARGGYVLTNHHVVKDADEILVTLKDRRALKAELIGSDPQTDIAVLRVEAPDLKALPLGDSDQLEVGDYVVAIGNPFGLGQTVTLGIVSALGRSGLRLEAYEDFIQTDAPINPGNSGGALVDLHGQLIGINTAIVAPTGGNVGIGFAIPINMARLAMEQIIEYGEVRRGRLGIVIQDITPDLAKGLRLESLDGALISQVVPGSPAAGAGLEPGDVIRSIDGKEVRGVADLRNEVGLRRIGEEVELQILRRGKKRKATLAIGPADDPG
ncbi:MAG: Do family serine endopeptidase [Kiloniellales bacterium]|nr:Do family serine endopeptidase [Kiloniellales bacterium]MDJ0982603.1 Do family serine endopeptidase [Kiloniellales bacterium]